MLDFPDMVAKLRTATEAGQPVRHQAITLLWAIGNARRDQPRLVRWSAAQEPLRALLLAHSLPTSKATPEYPFVALARTPWWELPDVQDVPRAHGSTVLPWLNTHDPFGGLRADVYAAMRDDESRAVAVGALLERFFPGADTTAVLRATGLATVRDPKWAWDELVLACDLTARNNWRERLPDDPAVVELSALLRALPLHPEETRGPRFRSPSSVRRKMADLATNHPDSTRKKTHAGSLDLQVIAAFIARPDHMRASAEAIRAGALSGEFAGLEGVEPDPEEGAVEGKLLLLRHYARERDTKKREEKISQVLAATGCLECEVCGFDFARTYGERGERYAEVHHRVPLHVTGETSTRLADLAILCANCHRMIHRRRDWLTPEELREIVRRQ